MKKRGDYLKKAYYHLMKIEQKKNKILEVENYGEINAESVSYTHLRAHET